MNLLKRLSLLLLFVSFSVLLYGQGNTKLALGINAGITCSSLSGEGWPGSDYSWNLGYETGLCSIWGINSRLSLETNVILFQNGFTSDVHIPIPVPGIDNPKSYAGSESHQTQDYLNNSCLLGYDFGKNFVLTVQGGGYWAVYLQTHNLNFGLIYTL